MPGPVKIDGIPVKQCQFSPQASGKGKEMETCGKSIQDERRSRESKGERCSVYMNSFEGKTGVTTVLTLVCDGTKRKSAHPIVRDSDGE